MCELAVNNNDVMLLSIKVFLWIDKNVALPFWPFLFKFPEQRLMNAIQNHSLLCKWSTEVTAV